MSATNNIFSPSSSKPIMTRDAGHHAGLLLPDLRSHAARSGHVPQKPTSCFAATRAEVIFAHTDGLLATHDRVRLANPDFGRKSVYGDSEKKVIETTVGRVIFSEIWPLDLGFPNIVVGKSKLGDLIWNCYKHCGHDQTVLTLDRLKELGFREATRAGVSIGIDDMIIPKEKNQEIEVSQKQIADVEKQYRRGVITPGERLNKIIDIWTHCTDQIANVMLKTLEYNQGKREYNPVHLMVDSGARGNKAQVRQLAGVRGLMARTGRFDHRKADSLKFPRRIERVGVFHLDSRRPQGSGGHGAQDGRFRVHDPQPRRCGAGRDHPRGRLRDQQRHLGAGHFRG